MSKKFSKFKKLLVLPLTLAILCPMVLTPSSISVASNGLWGQGTQESPWLISDAQDFVTMSELIAENTSYADDYYQMTNDIDFTNVPMTPIGKTNSFSGVFDGQLYKVKNLIITDTSQNTGLFALVKGGTVKNLGVVSSTITGGDTTGAIAGRVEGAGVIMNCYSKATVSGTRSVGGIVGVLEVSEISNCYSAGTVSGTANGIGGIVGNMNTYQVSGNIKIDNVYSIAAVSGSSSSKYVGKLIGYDSGMDGDKEYNRRISITNVYYSGNQNASGWSGRTATKLTESQLTDGTLLSYLNTNANAVNGYQQWIEGDDLYPEFTKVCTISGEGTEAAPYIVDTINDLLVMADMVNLSATYAGAHYKLTSNLDLSGVSFNGMALLWPFTGTFDGTGHVLKNVSIDKRVSDNTGIFHRVVGGTVKNFGIESGTVRGGDYVGGIIGYAENATVLNCFNAATVRGYNKIGGLIGTATNSSISNSFNKGRVRIGGMDTVGGLVGAATMVTIRNCYNIGRVGIAKYTGRLIGYTDNAAVIENVYYDKEAAVKNQPIGSYQNFAGAIGMTNAELKTESFVATLNANLKEGYMSWEYGEDKIARLSEFEETARLDVFMASIEGMTVENNKLQMITSADGKYETVLYGSDNRNVIDLDGNVYQPLTAQKVLLILDIKDTASGKIVKRLDRNIEITIAGQYADSGANEVPNVVPGLREWYGLEGNFSVTEDTKIAVANTEITDMAYRIQEYMKDMFKLELEVIEGTGNVGDIVLRYVPERISDLRDEGYAIEIDEQIIIEAPTETGVLYGAISIMQIMQQDETHSNVPKGYVRDYPQYELRGGQLSTSPTHFSLEYLEEIAKYMSWYKLNTLQLEASVGKGEFGKGLKLESKKYPELNNSFGEYVWSQDDYRQFQKNLKAYGVDVITLIANSPGHAEYLQSLAGNIMSGSNLDLSRHYDEALSLMKDIYDEFLDGDDPVIQNAIVHIGTDESSNTGENMRRYINDFSQYLLAKDNVDKVVFWGNQSLYYKGNDINTENVIAQLWDCPDFRADEALAQGFEIINSNSKMLYLCPFTTNLFEQGYVNGNMFSGYVDLAAFYETWRGGSDFDTHTFTNPAPVGGRDYFGEYDILKGDPKILGSMFCEFDRYGDVNDYNVLELVIPHLAGVAEKCWYGDTDRFETGEEFVKAFEKVGDYAAYANPRNRVESDTSTIASFDFEKMTNGIVKGQANGYDATVTNGTLQSANGSNALALNGATSVQLPFGGVGYPYTVTFDLYLNGKQSQDAILFSGEHGTFYLNYEGNGVAFMTNRSLHTFNAQIPTNKWVRITITSQAPTLAYSSTNVTVLMINDTEYRSTSVTGAKKSTQASVLGTENMFAGVKGYVDNLVIYNLFHRYLPLDGHSFEGKGTESSPYLIKSAEDLQLFALAVSEGSLAKAYFKLTSDINMTGMKYWVATEFKGVLDGDGHEITNLTISETSNNVGLIGFLNGGTIKNLGVVNSTITSRGEAVGAIAGQAKNSSVIMNCYSKATVSGTKCVGGIVGVLEVSEISNCYSAGTVSGTGNGIGGIVGNMNTYQVPGNIKIDNVYSIAAVSGSSSSKYVGKLIGYDSGVDGDTEYNRRISITNVYYSGDQNASGWSGRTATKLTATELTDGTLLKKLNSGLQEGYETWVAGEKGYPQLRNNVCDHSFSNNWSFDDNNHWHACNNQGCNVVSDKDPHSYENACDTTCDCGYTRTVEHDFTGAWQKNETHHWNECTSCEQELNKAPHSDGDNNGKCDSCDYTMTTENPEPVLDSQPPVDLGRDNARLGTGAIIGIAIAAVAVVGGGVALSLLAIKKKRKH